MAPSSRNSRTWPSGSGGLPQGAAQRSQGRWQVAAGVLDEGLQHPDLDHAAVPTGLGGRGVQPVQQAEQSSRRGCSGRRVAALPGTVLGEEEPRQSQVLVLAHEVGRRHPRRALGPGPIRQQTMRSPAAICTRAFIAAMGRTSG